MQQDFNEKIGRAAKWSSITEIASKLVAPITNWVLVRVLAPEAFGVVATLMLVVSFTEIFTDAGFQRYLIQHEFADEEDRERSTNVAFWTNLVLSLVALAVIACFATPIAQAVGSPGKETAIIAMSLEIPILAFSSIQTAQYRRDFDFKTLFVVRVCTAFIPLAVTVPLALAFRSFWALVLGTLVRDIFAAIILTLKSKWKPKLVYDFKRLKEMVSFTSWTVVENITIWLTGNIGTFIISSSLTTYYLGLYKTTVSTVNSYMSIITAATTPVLFSALSRCQNDRNSFNDIFFRFQRMVSMLIFPLGVGLFVYRKLATLILLGGQWLETADFLGLWALVSAVSIIFNNYNGEAFRSQGKPKLSVLVQALHLVALIPVLIWSVGYGFEFLAWARSLVRFQLILVSCIVLRVAIKIKFTDMLRNVYPSLISSAVMGVAGVLLRRIWSTVIWELATIVICVFVYAGVMLLIPAGRKQLAEVPIIRRILKLKV